MKAGAEGIRPVSLELGGKNAALVFADCDFDVAVEHRDPLVLRELRPGLPRHRARLRRAADLRQVRHRAQGQGRRHEAGPTRRPGDQDRPAGQQGAPRQGAVLLQEGQGRRRQHRYRRRRAGDAGRLSRTAAGCSRRSGPACRKPRRSCARRSSVRAATSSPSTPKRTRCAWPTTPPYGLATSIYTNDLSRAHRLAAKIEVGLCWINSWFLRDLRTPFGGSKHSGIGREGGVHSLEFYTELRNVMVKY